MTGYRQLVSESVRVSQSINEHLILFVQRLMHIMHNELLWMINIQRHNAVWRNFETLVILKIAKVQTSCLLLILAIARQIMDCKTVVTTMCFIIWF